MLRDRPSSPSSLAPGSPAERPAAVLGSAGTEELGAARWRRGAELQSLSREEGCEPVSFHDADTLEISPSRFEAPESVVDGTMLLVVMAGRSVGQVFHVGERDREMSLGRSTLCDITLSDAEVSRRHAAIRWSEGERGFVVADLRSRNGTYLNGQAIDEPLPLASGDKLHLGPSTLLRVASPFGDEARYAQTMNQAALRDPLTGAYNRRYLDERLIAEVAYSNRHEAPFSVMIIDIDHFKEVNDRHGHGVGDIVLTDVVELITSTVRDEDIVARYGGEEIVILCRGTDESEACLVAERVRRTVEEASFTTDQHVVDVTVSIGIAGLAETAAADARLLLAGADIALYAAKAAGRNRCRAASLALESEH